MIQHAFGLAIPAIPLITKPNGIPPATQSRINPAFGFGFAAPPCPFRSITNPNTPRLQTQTECLQGPQPRINQAFGLGFPGYCPWSGLVIATLVPLDYKPERSTLGVTNT